LLENLKNRKRLQAIRPEANTFLFGNPSFSWSYLFVIFPEIITLIAGTISLFIAAILHFLIRTLGGSETYEEKDKSTAYATAVLSLAWIPYIGIIFELYSVYLWHREHFRP